MDDFFQMDEDDEYALDDLLYLKSLALHVVGQRFNRILIKDVNELREIEAGIPDEHKPKHMFIKTASESVGQLIKDFFSHELKDEFGEEVEMMQEIEAFDPDGMFALEPDEAKRCGLHEQAHVVAVEAEIIRPLEIQELFAYMRWFDDMDAIGLDSMPALLVVDRYGRGDFVNLVHLWHAQLRISAKRRKDEETE